MGRLYFCIAPATLRSFIGMCNVAAADADVFNKEFKDEVHRIKAVLRCNKSSILFLDLKDDEFCRKLIIALAHKLEKRPRIRIDGDSMKRARGSVCSVLA